MYEYIRGLLVSNKPGAQIPGSTHPVDRWLSILTLGRTSIRVFDWLPPATGSDRLLSEHEGIREGNAYTFILLDLPAICNRVTARLARQMTLSGGGEQSLIPIGSSLRGSIWPSIQGTLGSLQGMLVETAIGQVILSRSRADRDEQGRRLPHAPPSQREKMVCWKHIRFDLLAILAEQA